ncbi:MAG: hypothetical protein AB8F95_07890 [Bacteroidia bacterium]
MKITWAAIALMYIMGWMWLSNPQADLLTGDASGYYQYLPAATLHGDLNDPRKSAALRVFYSINTPVPPDSALLPHPTGRYIGEDTMMIKYTMGVAIMQSPFFVLGHITAWITGHDRDGYSPPYRYWVSFGKVAYVLLGLWWLGQLLISIFDKKAASLSLLLIALATQLFFFTCVHQSMSHPFLFMLYCGLMLATHRWYAAGKEKGRGSAFSLKSSTTKAALAIGFAAGMITLTRPTELICLFIPLLYGVGGLSAKFAYWGNRWRDILAAIGVFALCAVPQIVYWKLVSGQWVFYSYGDEGFDFLDPELLNGLFSYKNGWLVYAPAMIFALLGMLVLLFPNKKQHNNPKAWRWPVWLFVPIHIYITYSWWCWNYINGFGSRPMVQAGAMLSIPLALFVAWSFRFSISRWLFTGLAALLIISNIFQSWQFYHGILFSEDANRAYFWEIIGTTELKKEDLLAFDSNKFHPPADAFTPDERIYQFAFEDSVDDHFVREPLYEGSFSYKLDWGHQYGTHTAQMPAGEYGLKPDQWLKVSVKAWQQPGFRPTYEMASIVTVVNRADSNLHMASCRINNKIGGPPYSLYGNTSKLWDEVYYFFKMPSNLVDSDVFKVFCWNRHPHPIYIDNMEVWTVE